VASSIASSSPSRAPLPGASVKLFVAGGAIALAVVYLVLVGLQSTTVYFLTVGELQSKGPAAQNQLYRVSGLLVPGSLTTDSSGVGIRFQIADATEGARPLSVVYRGGQVPDIIGDNIEIVTEGKLDAQGTFAANSVLAKCPSRLENAPPEEHDYGSTG
jgi:cytochrome c-type biogenesis protein CcmE